MKKKKDEITIRSSAAEYLTYVASVGDQQDSIEMRYEDENIWLTQKMMATLYDVGLPSVDKDRHGFDGQKYAHTTSSPLTIRQVFSSGLSLSVRISAPAKLPCTCQR